MVKLGSGSGERSRQRGTSGHIECTDVHFVCHDLGPRGHLKVVRLPAVCVWVVDHRVADGIGELARSRIILPVGRGAALNGKLVLRARLDQRYIARPPTVALAGHRMR